MKKILLLAMFLCYCFFCYSQSNSAVANQSLTSKVFNADSVSKNAFEFAKLSPFNIRKLMPLQYSNISIGFNYEKGDLMEAQNAGKIKNTYIKTEGSTKLGSVMLFGLFSYCKTFEDSTMYNHQTRNNTTAPYYFGSPINVSYERAVYNLSALAEKNLINNNLPVGFGADYRIGNHFSTNDPRGAISDFQFNLIGTLGYTFFNRLKIGAAYRYGYGQERFSVDYKNNNFSQIVLLPAYNNHLVNGYGEAYIRNTERDYNNDESRNGFDANVNFETGNFGDLYFTYSHIEEHQKYLRSSPSGRTDLINIIYIKMRSIYYG
ncbi:DUF6850 family outer membrane beta-barrel protein [Pedobacter lithocola]|uniref:DUF6850 family outer membrane beta-barrel protein n=1 Tax=Pedobacter lithocola TaxID=1908239 RepID=A0ABV8PBC8_9SPHI